MVLDSLGKTVWIYQCVFGRHGRDSSIKNVNKTILFPIMELLDEIHMEGILAFAALIGKQRARKIKCKVACQAELWSRRKGKVDRKRMGKSKL